MTLRSLPAPRHRGALALLHLRGQRAARAHTNTVRQGICRQQRGGDSGDHRASERRAVVAGATPWPVPVSAEQGWKWVVTWESEVLPSGE